MTSSVSLFAWFPLVLGSVWSGVAAQAPLPRLDEYQVRQFGAGEGLPVRWIDGFAITGDGVLYVPTGRGLLRFDGERFRHVGSSGFEGSYMSNAVVDRGNRVWARGRDGEIGFVLDRQPYTLTSRLSRPDRTFGFTATRDGAMWIGGTAGLTRVSPGAEPHITRYRRADGLPSDTTIGVFSLPDGEEIAVTARGLARVRRGSGAQRLAFEPVGPSFHLPASSAVPAVTLVDAAGLWIALEDRVLAYRSGRSSSVPSTPPAPGIELSDIRWPEGREALLRYPVARHIRIPPVPLPSGDFADRVTMVLRTRQGTLWIAATSSADRNREYLLRQRDGRLEPVSFPSWATFDRINFLLEDHEGSLWIATDQGAFQLVPLRVRALTRRHGLAHPFTTSVIQTRDGAVWVGTWGGGLHRFVDGGVERVTAASGLPSDQIRALYEARDGTLWVGTEAGFAALRDGRLVDRRQGPVSRTIFGASLEEVRAFAETADGTLWMGGAGGLYRRDPETGWIAHRPDLFRALDIWMLHAARDGALWVGGSGGLLRIDDRGIRSFDERDGLRSSFVVSAFEEADGTLWLGTYRHGLHRWRNGRFTAVTTADGLHADGVWRVLEDDRGGLWMSSDRGVFRVSRDALHAVADGARFEGVLSPIVLREPEGMPSRESNRASPGGWRLADGRLLFNSQDGLAVVAPDIAMRRSRPVGAVIQRVLADGQPLPGSGESTTTVPLGSRHIAFEFFALSYRAPGLTRYRYRLDGYDVEWSYAAARRRASYTNLPPGDYTFRVQATNGSGPWRGPEARHAVVVPPFLWQRASVRVAAALALLGLLILGYRYHVSRLLQTERLRLRIAADLHDDVGSNLSSIALLSEMLMDRLEPQGLAGKQLGRLRDAAADTVDSLREVIWLVDPKHGNTMELVSRLRSVAGDLLNDIPHTIEVRDIDSRPLTMTFMRNVLLLYKEALHNVVKHAEAGHVMIRVGGSHHRLTLSIEDDGGGFPDPPLDAGYGLRNMRRRAEEIDGELSVTSDAGGTRIVLVAKIP